VNIQKLISSVRQAKKRRAINDFHRAPRSGIDVTDEEFNDTLSLLKELLKQFKANGCKIDISFYGEVFILLPEGVHRFELAISNRPNIKSTEGLLKKLEGAQFVKLDNWGVGNTLVVSSKTLRNNAEWKHYSVSKYTGDYGLFTETILKDLRQRVRYYNNSNLNEWTINDSNTEDKLAAIHFGGALFGPTSMLFYLSKHLRKIIYVKELSITDNQITVNKSYLYDETNHYFGKKEADFFDKYLFSYADMGSDDDNHN
jgi:hypothetical protein